MLRSLYGDSVGEKYFYGDFIIKSVWRLSADGLESYNFMGISWGHYYGDHLVTKFIY